MGMGRVDARTFNVNGMASACMKNYNVIYNVFNRDVFKFINVFDSINRIFGKTMLLIQNYGIVINNIGSA